MSAREPRFEVVRGFTLVGWEWHARYRGANGRIVWWTETYTRRRYAVRAIESITGHIVEPDETGRLVVKRSCRGEDVEVREVGS